MMMDIRWKEGLGWSPLRGRRAGLRGAGEAGGHHGHGERGPRSPGLEGMIPSTTVDEVGSETMVVPMDPKDLGEPAKHEAKEEPRAAQKQVKQEWFEGGHKGGVWFCEKQVNQ